MFDVKVLNKHCNLGAYSFVRDKVRSVTLGKKQLFLFQQNFEMFRRFIYKSKGSVLTIPFANVLYD